MRQFPDDLLDQMRQMGDPLADRAAAALFAHPQAAKFRTELSQVTYLADALPNGLPDEVAELYQTCGQLPTWADRRKIDRAALFFAEQVQPIMGLLGSYALPYCYGAANGAQVLHLSDRIRKDTYRRLTETGKFVFDVLEPGAFSPTGKAFRAIAQVRLVHAAIRYHIRKSGQWNAEWGVPVNQEDMAGTNLAFSLIILRGLRKIGVVVSPATAEAYLHVWQVIGHLLGCQTEVLPTSAKEAYWLAKRIEDRQFRESEAGKALTQALLDSYANDVRIPMPDGYITAYMRYLLGDELSDLLGIPAANWTKSLVQPIVWANVAKSLSGIFPIADPEARIAEAKKLTVERVADVRISVPGKLSDQ